MKQRSVLFAPMLLLIGSIILSACGGASTNAPAAAAPTAASQEATSAPTTADAQPTTAAAAPAEGDKAGGRLILVDGGDNSQLDPFPATWHATAMYSVFDTLINYSPDLTSFVAGLADSWEISADNLSLTLKLHPDVKFQDGTVMDAEAVKWNIEQYSAETTTGSYGGILGELVTEVQTPDATTVVLKMSRAYAPLFDFLAGMEIVSPTAYKAAGPDTFGQKPVGAGKWIVKEMVVNDHILFERFGDYAWGPSYVDNKGAMFPDEFEIKTLKDEATIYATLETGEAHIAALPAQFVKQARENANLEVVQGLNNGLDYMGFNTEHKPFDNANIRKAIGMAINREEIIAAGYEGEAQPVYGPLSPTEFGYSETVETKAKTDQSYDPEKATAALAAEGWTDSDGDGVLDNNGEKMEIRFIYPASDTYKRIAETIQAQLSDIGVKLNLEGKEEAALKEETVAGTHEMFLLYFGLIDPRILCLQYCSANINGSNRTRYNNPELDPLLAAADAAVDPSERKAKVEAILSVLIENRPMIPLLVTNTFTAYRKDMVGGLKFDSLGGAIFNDAYLIKK